MRRGKKPTRKQKIPVSYTHLLGSELLGSMVEMW